ncbi:hypothetical protein QW131_26260 [Roseibium salinum]|nr:hypothetical protein [Roseibium salinum]
MSGTDSLGLDAFFRSGLVGGSIGYDQQANRVIFGASLEGALTNFRGDTRSGSARQSSNWLSAATVRIGYDAGRFMPYLSAGVGFGNYKVERKSDGASDEKHPCRLRGRRRCRSPPHRQCFFCAGGLQALPV